MAIQTVKTGAAVNDGTGDDSRTSFTKINQNFTDSANAASRQVGTAVGNVMEVGAFGLGAAGVVYTGVTNFSDLKAKLNLKSQIFRVNGTSLIGTDSPALYLRAGDTNALISTAYYDGTTQLFTWSDASSDFIVKCTFLTTANTQVDTSNGYIKGASPIIKLFTDRIELNDEAKLQDITLEKLGVGDYLIKGSLGFAQGGWYIETPKDANGNVLVAVVYEQLANNDISVKTYDYMLNKKGRIVPDLETPLDIPETRWIDLRLQALPQTTPLSKDQTVATNAE